MSATKRDAAYKSDLQRQATLRALEVGISNEVLHSLHNLLEDLSLDKSCLKHGESVCVV